METTLEAKAGQWSDEHRTGCVLMNGFERSKEKKKRLIRETALELYRKYGFKKVSLNDIARAAGISHVTIYNHFGSKEGLEKDILKTIISDLVKGSLQTVTDESTPFLEKLQTIIDGKVKVAGQFQGELLNTVVHEYPEMRAFIDSLWSNEIAAVLKSFIDGGRRDGLIRPELSDTAIYLYFDLIRRGAYADQDFLQKIKGDPRIAREINDIVIFGLVRKLP
jgi:AcrR family transcriptional regulator